MPIDEYPLGQPVRLRVSFVDGNGTPADPSTTVLTLKPPAEDALTFGGGQLTDDTGEGNFSLVVVPDKAGDWNWEWMASVPFIAVSKGVFTVAERNV